MEEIKDFWTLLKRYNVVIPKIQRDYAQGRTGKEYIRKKFLKEIKESLENSTAITLDFVYGNTENDNFYPLDGQQRLTTLWLVYWYISLRTGKLTDQKSVLQKFKYETRASSTDFCNKLCELDDITINGSLVKFIKSQTWFMTAWLKDPTIEAMLRTLGGDDKKSSSTEADNIEDVFSDVEDFSKYDIENNKISFKLMRIGNEELPISDDLYIKMNARGKSLSDFENLKADYIGWMQSEDNEDYSKYSEKHLSSNLQYRQYLAAQIDNKWTDVIWNNQKNSDGFDGNIDKIFFSFINKFILNELCIKEDISVSLLDDSSDSLKKVIQTLRENTGIDDSDELHLKKSQLRIKESFDYLYGTKKQESDAGISYCGFDPYKKYWTYDNSRIIDNIFEKIEKEDIAETLQKYKYIPSYDFSTKKLAQTTQNERVYFLAISLFLGEDNTFDIDSFKKWMRVVSNLVENAEIASISAMGTCLRLVNKLWNNIKKYEYNVYLGLQAYEDKDNLSKTRLGSQVQEEKEKAIRILTSNDEDKIIIAEKYGFFDGSIRFLYRDEKGNANWDQFDQKYKAAKKFFPDANTVRPSTIMAFLKQFPSVESIYNQHFFTTIGYHPRNYCWKRDILCNSDLQEKVHKFLMEDYSDNQQSVQYEEFLKSGLVEIITAKNDNYKFRYHWYYGRLSIHMEYHQDCVFFSDDLKPFFEQVRTLEVEHCLDIIDKEYNLYCAGYYWGAKLSFRYEDKDFVWDITQNQIYLSKAQEKCLLWDNAVDLISVLKKLITW